MRWTPASLAILTLAAVLAAACSGGRDELATPGGPAGGAGDLPELPTLHGSAAVSESLVLGKDALDHSSGAMVSGDALLLDASGSGPGGGARLEWALYAWTPGPETPLSLSLALGYAEGSAAWAALPDYSSGSWSMQGPFTDDPLLAVDPATNISPDGYCYCVVLASPGNNLQVDSLTLALDDGAAPLPGDHAQLVDPAAGQFSSLRLAGGHPAIGYFSPQNYEVRFTRALDAAGSQWGAPQAIASDAGFYLDMEIVSGNPAFLYTQYPSRQLMFRRAANSAGTAWGDPVVVAANLGAEQFLSLALINGKPAACVASHDSYKLYYIAAVDAAGTAWQPAQTVASAVVVNFRTALLDSGGAPMVFFGDRNNGKLCYVRSFDALGAGWGPVTVVPQSANAGIDSISVALVEGCPAVAYQSEKGQRLNYLRANDPQGGSWGGTVLLDAGQKTGYFTDMAVLDGVPVVVYKDGGPEDLWLVRASDSTGAAWGLPLLLDNHGRTGFFGSLLPLAEGFGISYIGEVDNQDLRYLHLGAPAAQ